MPDENREELRRYARRVGERWPLERLLIHRSDDAYVVVLVSRGFDGVPWLERVRQATSLWDAAEMGANADVHCYTPVELERKLAQLPAVRAAAERGTDVLAVDA
ncbi:MAG: hypothetical protein M3141_02660 [Actinomycetota bacterium]|nr:hypothetical protein [Actinomycetota bacterium]